MTNVRQEYYVDGDSLIEKFRRQKEHMERCKEKVKYLIWGD